MGGDDLCGDDEYLREPITESFTPASFHVNQASQISKKRNRIESEDSGSGESKKRPFTKVLLESSRHLERESAETQCAFLGTTLLHNMSNSIEGGSIDKSSKLFPHYFRTSNKETLAARISESISAKKIKNWNHVGSPMVIIICLSARRAVAVLKELAFWKIRAAKLFAKHMDVDQQRIMLRTTAFGLAIGTPHRLLSLCSQQSDEGPEDGVKGPALRLEKSQLIIFDAYVNGKGYTVCSLPDTAPACMQFLSDHILPDLSTRKDLKLAFF